MQHAAEVPRVVETCTHAQCWCHNQLWLATCDGTCGLALTYRQHTHNTAYRHAQDGMQMCVRLAPFVNTTLVNVLRARPPYTTVPHVARGSKPHADWHASLAAVSFQGSLQ